MEGEKQDQGHDRRGQSPDDNAAHAGHSLVQKKLARVYKKPADDHGDSQLDGGNSKQRFSRTVKRQQQQAL